MALLFGGICYLMGSYANMIRKAERAREENQITFDKLRTAYQKLQGYSVQRLELAAAKERTRFARELHDSVTQTVFSMNLVAQTARVLWESNPVRIDAQCVRFLELADDAMQQIQTLVDHLGLQRVTTSGFIAAIEQLIAERKTLDDLIVTIELLGKTHLAEDVNQCLFRIIQEALTNVTKHSGTQHAVIRLDLVSDPQYIEIEDQGGGFDLANSKIQSGHIGLLEMKERAKEIGWALSIDTHPGHGTCVRVENTMDRK